jgi:predicted helicase
VNGTDLGERNPKWLNDDYVKFIRFGQSCIADSGSGVLAFISNHGYLANPTFRGMRQSLTRTFGRIWLLDLHGNSKIKERCPDGGADENVFDIQQGVAIGAFAKAPRGASSALSVHHGELWGAGADKYRQLTEGRFSSLICSKVSPSSPFFMFVPQDEGLRDEYNQWMSITEILPVRVLGFQSHRDRFATDLDEPGLRKRIEAFRGRRVSDDKIRERYEISDGGGWAVASAREQLRKDRDWKRHFGKGLYRPFDERSCYFSTAVMDRPRRELLDHVVGKDNIVLCVSRIVKLDSWQHALVSSAPPTAIALDINGSYAFPLYLYEIPRGDDLFGGGSGSSSGTERTPNLTRRFVEKLWQYFGLPDEDTAGGIRDLSPSGILSYLYAVLHSPRYRARHLEFLRIDFPRVPVPSSRELFEALGRLGSELVALHLLESATLDEHITSLIGDGEMRVEKVSYSDETVWLHKAKNRGFQGVADEVWSFRIGGYQVCEKWLKDRQAKGGKNPRPGRVLTDEDIDHYQKIVVALSETIRIMAEIDEVIEAHGGWPGAFQPTNS